MLDLHTTVLARSGNVSVRLRDVFLALRRRRRLRPLALEVLAEQVILQAARDAGLSVTAAELQQAADRFRRRYGLNSAELANAWLAWHGLSVVDFEDALDRDLLIDKWKDHLTRDRIAPHFAANQAGYARLGLRLILVPRQDLARELVAQIREEGRDFAELAREHSLHPSRAEGGRLGLLMRRQLPLEIADVVFAARAGEVVGPLAGPQGFQLFLIETHRPAELDAELAGIIRQELFDAWLKEQLANGKLEFPLLEAF
jgi:parvulin-like peptidyl-prolyl isomerase